MLTMSLVDALTEESPHCSSCFLSGPLFIEELSGAKKGLLSSFLKEP